MLEQADLDGTFSPDQFAAAADLYTLSEKAAVVAAPAVPETQVVASLGSEDIPAAPSVEVTSTPNLAWVEEQLGVDSAIAPNTDISLTVAALDAEVLPPQQFTPAIVEAPIEATPVVPLAPATVVAQAAPASIQETPVDNVPATPITQMGIVTQADVPTNLIADNDYNADMGVLGINNQASVEHGESLWAFSARQLKEMGLDNPSAVQIQNAVDNISLMNAEQLLMSPAGANLIHEGDTFIIPASLDEMTREVTAQDWEALDKNMAEYEAGVSELGNTNQAYTDGFQKPCVGQTTNLECLGVDFLKGSTGAYSLDDLMTFGKPPSMPVVADNSNVQHKATGTLGL